MEKEPNNAVPSSSANGSANHVVGDEGVAADISARDEYNPNWKHNYDASVRQTNAHKALQIALYDVIRETVQDQETVQDIIQETVQDVIQESVQDALDNHDFDNIVSEVIDNHNFDDIVGEAMEDRFGELFRQHVRRLYINCER